MKKILATFCLTLFITTLLYSQQNEAMLSFDTKEHNFGTIPEEIGSASCEFVFTNTGNAPLVLNKVLASCGCTTPSWPKEPIAPGKTGKVVVTYKTKGRPGAFHKSISVFSNSRNGIVTLLIKGDVTPKSKNPESAYPYDLGDGLRINKREIKIATLKNNETKTEIISIYNNTTSPIEVKCNTHNSKFVTTKDATLKLKPKDFGQFTITINGKEAPEIGRIKDYIYITPVNGKQDEKHRVNIVATVIENFDNLSKSDWENAPIASFSKVFLQFNNTSGKKTSAQKIEVTNTGKTPLKIRKVIVENELFSISGGKETIKPGNNATYTVHLKNDAKIKGNASGAIVFITNDPSAPVRTVKVIANL